MLAFAMLAVLGISVYIHITTVIAYNKIMKKAKEFDEYKKKHEERIAKLLKDEEDRIY